MSRALWLLSLFALALAGCDKAPPAQEPTPQPAVDQPALDVPPATAVTPDPSDGLAHYGSYGDLKFGMTDAETRAAWGGKLNGGAENGARGGKQTCYSLSPFSDSKPPSLKFMIEDDKFVRYDVSNDKLAAPGGGKVGMSAAQIDASYPGRVTSSPHKYVKDGRYLRIKGNDGSGGVLVFETDAAGAVTTWRIGQPPAVDYVEGCS